VYELGGLDPEAASTLAERILERHNATKYRQDTDLLKLLKLLDGFPLALEVVLANLARQTLTEVLIALQAGDVSLDKGNAQQKTESILRSIDYSHSNLSPEAQQLLLCLAPFTSVVWQDMLEQYPDYMRQKPALATLPFDRWPEVLQEAQSWGLLSPDPNIPGFLRLQPTLPYFLRSRLSALEQAEVRTAVETAFRDLYDQVGRMLYRLLDSKDPQQRQVGQLLTGLEYENLVHALNLALEAQASIEGPLDALGSYLEAMQDNRRGLELFQNALARLEKYSPEQLSGPLGVELVRLIGTIGNWQLDLKEYTAAEASYQKLLKVLLQLEHIESKVKNQLQVSTYGQLGKLANEQRQWDKAEQYFQQVLQVSIDSNDHFNEAMAYHMLGSVALGRHQLDQAAQYYRQALQAYTEANDRYSQATTYRNLGSVVQEQRQLQQAEQYYQQALQIFIEYNYRYNQATTYNNLGSVAQEQRQWRQAEQYYQQTLQIFIEYNDRYNQATTYHNLGMVAKEQRQWRQAEQYYQQTLQIFIEYGNRYEQAATYHQLGVVARQQGQLVQAEQHSKQALQIYIDFNDRYNQAMTNHLVGNIAFERGQFEQAEQYYQQALQIYIENNDRYEQAGIYHQLGRVAEEQRHWQQAREHFLRALETFVAYQDDHKGGIVLSSLAVLLQASGDAGLPAAVASILHMTPAEAERLLREMVGE
jgi:tetratricopeptide (TPR) repeat protein